MGAHKKKRQKKKGKKKKKGERNNPPPKKEPSINFKRQQALGRLRKAQYDLGRMSPVGKNGVTKADVKKANELVSKLQKEYDSLSKD